MKLLTGVITLLLINTLAGCGTVRVEDTGAGGSNQPAKEQSDSGTKPKPASSTAEPGCN